MDGSSIRPATLCAGYGMQRYTNSGQTMRAMLARLVLTSSVDELGNGRLKDIMKRLIALRQPPARPCIHCGT